MATVVTWNGSSYTVPATGEENWGGASKVDGLLVALVTHGFQKTGGTFALSADADFSSTAGLKSIYYKSRASSISSAGVVRLGNAEVIGWRNAADNGNNTLVVNSSDQLVYNGVVLAGSTGVVPVASGGTGLTSYTAGDLIYASGATTLAKLGIGTASHVLSSSGSAPQWGLLVNANVDASAAIALSKLATVTASRVLVSDGSGLVSASSVTTTTLGYLDATSSIQTQLNAKAALASPAFTTSARFSYATASTVPYFDSNKDLISSAVTPTELGYLSGVTSSIQTQLNAKEGTITTLAINKGGTGQATAQAAIDALLPSQTGNNGEFLTTDGTNCSWAAVSGGTWGTLTGTLSSQTDLQTALDAKVAHSSGASGRLAYWSGTATITSSSLLTYDAQNLSHTFSTAGSTAGLFVINANNSNTASHAMLKAEVGGTSGGDPLLYLNVSGGTGWYAGVDNSASDVLMFGTGSAVGTNPMLRVATDGLTSFYGAGLRFNTAGVAAQATEIYAGSSGANDGTLVIYGGAGVGAYIEYCGSTHASRPGVLNFYGAARIDNAGDFRIGATGNLSYGFERLSVRLVPSSANAASSHACSETQYLNNNDTAFSANQTAVASDFRRTISTNITDTGTVYSFNAGITLSVGAAATYTNAQNTATILVTGLSTSGGGGATLTTHAGLMVAGPTIGGGGSYAITSYAGVSVLASSVATGTRKTGLLFGAQSGATNNALIADTTYSGDWGVYLSSANPSYYSADFRIGSNAVNTTSTEKLTVANTRTGDALSHSGLNVLSTFSGNTAFSVSGNGILGGMIVANRTITASTTDTCVRMAGLFAQVNFSVAAAQTLTNAQTHGIAAIAIPGFPAVTGALAITHLSGLYIASNSIATGTNKYGIRLGDQSGATNNYAIHTGTGAVTLGDYLELRANHDPGAPTDAVRISSKVSTDAGTPNTLHFRTEQAEEATATFTQTHRLRVWVNNTEYYLSLDAV